MSSGGPILLTRMRSHTPPVVGRHYHEQEAYGSPSPASTERPSSCPPCAAAGEDDAGTPASMSPVCADGFRAALQRPLPQHPQLHPPPMQQQHQQQQQQQHQQLSPPSPPLPPATEYPSPPVHGWMNPHLLSSFTGYAPSGPFHPPSYFPHSMPVPPFMFPPPPGVYMGGEEGGGGMEGDFDNELGDIVEGVSPTSVYRAQQEAWNEVLTLVVYETSQRRELTMDYYTECEELMRWTSEWRRTWAAFAAEDAAGRNTILVEQKQDVIDIGAKVQAALTDPKKVYHQTRTDLQKERRLYKDELRMALDTSSVLLSSSKEWSLLETEQADQRHGVMYDEQSAFAAVLSAHAKASRTEAMSLRNKMLATEKMHQQAVELTRRTALNAQKEDEGLETRLRKEKAEKDKLQRALETALRKKEEADNELSLLRKEIKEYRKSDTQYAAQLTSCRKKHEAEVEKTKELRRKLEAEVKRTTDLAKRDAVSVSVMSQLREQMKEELATKAEEIEEKQSIINELEDDLNVARRRGEYEHAELQELKKKQRRHDAQQAPGEEPQEKRDLAPLLEAATQEKNEMYAALKQARAAAAHMFDQNTNCTAAVVALMSEYEGDIRASIVRAEAAAAADVRIMHIVQARSVV
eukprot:Rhum_TRINITY_DN12036_c1_g1::Rhum_TRINITY_DN12036_c1_g1_i1::g.48619::m.48619